LIHILQEVSLIMNLK